MVFNYGLHMKPNPNSAADGRALARSREMPGEDAEEYLLTIERLRRFDEARAGISAEELRDWMLRRREDPMAPCPTAKRTD